MATDWSLEGGGTESEGGWEGWKEAGGRLAGGEVLIREGLEGADEELKRDLRLSLTLVMEFLFDEVTFGRWSSPPLIDEGLAASTDWARALEPDLRWKIWVILLLEDFRRTSLGASYASSYEV
jgi:hypothetical protein